MLDRSGGSVNCEGGLGICSGANGELATTPRSTVAICPVVTLSADIAVQLSKWRSKTKSCDASAEHSPKRKYFSPVSKWRTAFFPTSVLPQPTQAYEMAKPPNPASRGCRHFLGPGSKRGRAQVREQYPLRRSGADGTGSPVRRLEHHMRGKALRSHAPARTE